MNKKTSFCITGITLLFLSCTFSSIGGIKDIPDANWKNIGLQGERIGALAIDPLTTTTIYAGTEKHGLYKSINGGKSWTSINNDLGDIEGENCTVAGNLVICGNTLTNATDILALAIDPKMTSTVYIGDSELGVFKSTDGGLTKQQINNGLTYTEIMDLVIDPTTSTTLYVTTNGGGLAKSSDGGKTWNELRSGLENLLINRIAIDPIKTNILYAETSKGVYKSIDGGNNWNSSNNGLVTLGELEINYLAINPINTNILFAGLNGALFTSMDSGSNWIEINTDKSFDSNNEMIHPVVVSIMIDPINPSILFLGSSGAGVGSGVFKSKDGGKNWVAIHKTDSVNTMILCLIIDPKNPRILYAGTDNGVYKITSGDV